jgi:hypothetical protein
MKAPRNPVVEACDFALGEMGLPPGPPAGPLLPTRAVTPGGAPISDSQPFIDEYGIAVRQPPVVNPSLLEHTYVPPVPRPQLHSQTPQPAAEDDEDGIVFETSEMPQAQMRQQEAPSPTTMPNEIILPADAQAFWNGIHLLLTADEVEDVRDVCRRAALRMLRAEQERLEDAMYPNKRKRTPLQKKGATKRKNVRRVRKQQKSVARPTTTSVD